MATSALTNIGINIENITKTFESCRALDGLSMNIEAGLLHGIIGPDGAGKTTLLRIIDGLLLARSGTITFTVNGTPIPFNEVRASIAYMPSRPSLYPDLSIDEHLEFFKSLYSLPEKDYRSMKAELLSITRLQEFSSRRVGQLSGGMYKKVGLMCALLRSPSVLLLDEPTNGVDPISRREFWELLYNLAAKHILVVVTTSYMDEAERCSRVHLIDGGKIIKSGEPGVLLKNENAKSFDELFSREEKK